MLKMAWASPSPMGRKSRRTVLKVGICLKACSNVNESSKVHIDKNGVRNSKQIRLAVLV